MIIRHTLGTRPFTLEGSKARRMSPLGETKLTATEKSATEATEQSQLYVDMRVLMTYRIQLVAEVELA